MSKLQMLFSKKKSKGDSHKKGRSQGKDKKSKDEKRDEYWREYDPLRRNSEPRSEKKPDIVVTNFDLS